MVKIIPFRQEHIRYIDVRDEEKCHANFNDINIRNVYKAYELVSLSFTGIDNGEVLGAAGIFEITPGVGEFWMLTGKDIKPKLSAIKAIKKMFDIIIMNTHFEKIQLHVDENFTTSINMVKWLGFKEVGKDYDNYFNKEYLRFEYGSN